MGETATGAEDDLTIADGAAARTFRRNMALTIGEIVCFSLGIAFADAGTVLASFVATLTGSAIVLGLLPTVFQIGIGLPQLATARFLSRRPRKMPVLIVASIWRNAAFFALAAVAWTRPSPAVLLTAFFVCYFAFAAGMGVESVAWLDIFAKVCPAEQRGRVFALGRTIANVVSFGAGFLVSDILAREGRFPRNYAFLFLLTALLMTAAAGVFALVREPIEASPSPPRPDAPAGVPDDRAVIVQGRRIWRQDPVFRRFVLARFAYVAHLVAIPFYLRFARDTVGVDDASIGRFVSAAMAGQIGANLLWGAISGRFGNRRVVQGTLLIAAVLPLYVLLTPRLPQGAFLIVYIATGAVLAGEVIGWMNLLLELAPPARRPLYVSLQSTILLPANLLPLLGGLALSVVPYRVFFGAIAVAFGAGFWLVSQVQETHPHPSRAT